MVQPTVKQTFPFKPFLKLQPNYPHSQQISVSIGHNRCPLRNLGHCVTDIILICKVHY